MRNKLRKFGSLVSLALLISFAFPGRSWAQPALRDWTVEDSVAVRYFANDQGVPMAFPEEGLSKPRGFIMTSPDGKYFFFLNWHGVLANDSNIFELSVFETEAVAKGVAAVKAGNRPDVRPVATARRADFTSDFNSQAGILDAEWLPGSDGVLFRGVDAKGKMQAFRLDVPSGKLRQLTFSDSDGGVLGGGAGGGIGYRDDGIVYTERTEFAEPEIPYPSMAIKRNPDGRPSFMHLFDVQLRTQMSYRGGAAKSIKSPTDAYLSHYIVAPGGRRACWRQNARRREKPPAIVVADLATGGTKETPFVLVSPITVNRPGTLGPSGAETVFWLDSDRLILVNVDFAGAQESIPGRIFEFDAKTGQSKELTSTNPGSGADPRPIRDVQWIESEKKILLDTGAANGPVARRELKIEGEAWKWSAIKAASAAAAPDSQFPTHPGFEVGVHQDANTPPVVVASNADSRLELTGPDAALAGVWRAEAKTVTWTEAGGKEGRGLLMLPRKNLSKDKPPPLVIQVYASQPGMFLPDGFTQAAFAAQPLVAQGMAVLQIGASSFNPRGFLQSLDSAIETLGKQGLIDTSRVGATGFSITQSMILHAVANPGKYPLTAAAGADGYDYSFPGYLNAASRDQAGPQVRFPGQTVGSHEKRYGAFFWEDKAKWLETELTYSMDRVRTPVLIFHHLRGEVKSRRDFKYHYYAAMIGAFNQTNKPIDLISLRDGMHSLKRPRERIAEMQGVVDWMAYWLQGRQPADPERAKTWAILRKQQDAVLASMNKTAASSQK